MKYFKKIILCGLIITAIIPTILSAQTFDILRPPMPDSMFLRVQRPDKDTISVSLSRYRVAASTRPEAKAFINGKSTKIYPSGAIVGLVDLKPGINVVRFTVQSLTGDSLWQEFVIQRPELLKTSPSDTLVIEEVMMEPSTNLWLNSDDVLEVKFKGSPGWEATFDIPEVESGLPMRELLPSETGGLGGVYVGRYKVKPTDELMESPITFYLRKSFWSKEKAYSKGKVSILPKELPRVAEIIGKRPFLNASFGEDRLGGAKLGFISAGVLVKITGKIGSQYRVQLSEQMQAWLPEEFAKLLPSNTPLPKSLAGAINTTSNETEDIITLALSNKLPYTSEQLINPNIIIVDVYGASSNTNWISLQPTIKGIESIVWRQVAADQYRMVVTLKHRSHWGYDIDYTNNTLRIKIKKPPVIVSTDSVLTDITIAIDAGHGGDNNGAIGATGALEKDITINIARYLENLLKQKGAKTILTRLEYNGPSNNERIDRILSSRANLLVSIHCNSAGDASDPTAISGVSTYYKYLGYKSFADIMNEKMLAIGLKQFGVIGSFNFMLNLITQIPNTLIETAFISNPEDEILLLDHDFRMKIAEQIVKGLEDYIKLNAEQKIIK